MRERERETKRESKGVSGRMVLVFRDKGWGRYSMGLGRFKEVREKRVL